MSAFHRTLPGHSTDLPGPLYFKLASRLGAYTGVVQARNYQRREEEKQGGGYAAPSGGRAPSSASSTPVRVSDETALGMLGDGWVERD